MWFLRNCLIVGSFPDCVMVIARAVESDPNCFRQLNLIVYENILSLGLRCAFRTNCLHKAGRAGSRNMSNEIRINIRFTQ